MKEYRLTEMETKLADIIWNNEPITSGNLVKLCEIDFNWKKSTTYTMLKRIQSKGIFTNENGTVSSLVKKDEFYAEQSNQFVESTFDGSLPRFFAAFTRSKKLSNNEIDELQRMINDHKED